jgi:hypothetical protein
VAEALPARVPGAERAVIEGRKLAEWVLAERGHGGDWARAFALAPEDAGLLEEALRAHVADNPPAAVLDNPAAPGARTYRVYGPVELAGRRAFVLSVWEVLAPDAPPRLVTAYPRRRGRR